MPGCRRGYLETVRDLPGSAGGNQRKRRLRVRPTCTHASVSSRTPLVHLSPDNYRISARNSPLDLTRGGKLDKVGSSPDRIMMDQGAKTYHLYYRLRTIPVIITFAKVIIPKSLVLFNYRWLDVAWEMNVSYNHRAITCKSHNSSVVIEESCFARLCID